MSDSMDTIEQLEADIKELRKEFACADYEQRILLNMDLAHTKAKLEKLRGEQK